MTKIIFREHDGKEQAVDVENGMTVMEAAIKNMIPGIDADCGGACACATCHVYVPDAWLEKLEPQSEMERSMLEFAENVTPNSRLGCQIKLVGSLDGLELMLPESQH